MQRLLLALIFSTALLFPGSGDFVSLIPKERIEEFWTAESAPAGIWSVQKGIIYCKGEPNGFLRSKKIYRNFILRAEWRFEPEGWVGAPEKWPNAGFFIFANEIKDTWPVSLEVQGYHGEAGSLFGVRGAKVEGARRGPFVTDRPPLGSWDKYEITAREGTVVVVLNGKKVNEGRNAVPSEGNICLQSEGWPVQYRNVAVKEPD
jgi:3-keto-disaccharide hydrolase